MGGGFAEGCNGSFPVRCHDVGHDKPSSGPLRSGTRTGVALAPPPSLSPPPQVRSDPEARRRRPPAASGAPAFHSVHQTCPVLVYPSSEPLCRGFLGGAHDRARPSGHRLVSAAPGGAEGMATP